MAEADTEGEGAIKVEPGLVVDTELQVKEELEATPLFTC